MLMTATHAQVWQVSLFICPPDLQFSGTRLWKTGPVIQTSILGPISSFAKWGWPISHTRALVCGGTSVHWSCHPFPETLPPAHTNTTYCSEEMTWYRRKVELGLWWWGDHMAPLPKILFVFGLCCFWQYFVQPASPGSLAQRECMPCYDKGARSTALPKIAAKQALCNKQRLNSRL